MTEPTPEPARFGWCLCGGHTNRELAALRNARKGTGNGVV